MRCALLLATAARAAALTIETRAALPAPVYRVHQFLATPANWPSIVPSSHSVEGCDTGQQLRVGSTIDENFGIPQLLPLQVQWKCIEVDASRGALRLASPAGLEGIATNCAMDFSITPGKNDDGCEIRLQMSYEPASPLAVLAMPYLMAENALALNVLLPRALESTDAAPLVMNSATGKDSEASVPSKLGTMDPIAGPLVKLARRFGLLPEEEADGWRGEPSSWASSDSLPQKFSEFSSVRLASFKQWAAERVAGDFDSVAIDARLDKTIAANGIVMFSFTSCPFCKGAKELLDAKKVSYSVVELDLDSEGAAMRARLGARTGRTSVPSVWIGGEYCGGLNDGPGIRPLEDAGMLDPKLRAVGALV